MANLFCAVMHVSPEMFTDWGILLDTFSKLAQNPFTIINFIGLIIFYNIDFTTSGISDSVRALTYVSPYKDGE